MQFEITIYAAIGRNIRIGNTNRHKIDRDSSAFDTNLALYKDGTILPQQTKVHREQQEQYREIYFFHHVRNSLQLTKGINNFLPY
jgi:hypothetical protein